MSKSLATFAAGCFWGVEEAFRRSGKCLSTVVGYTGGHQDNPTYKQVCSDRTGHAEACQVEFDPKVTKYQELLEIFWAIHDPTQLNRQGPDHGSQYRSAIFFHSPEQKAFAETSLAQHQAHRTDGKQIVTQIAPAATFWKAEDYHQQYIATCGIAACHI